jgi:hypothetical protein
MLRDMNAFHYLGLTLLATSVVAAQAGTANNVQLSPAPPIQPSQMALQSPIHTDPETALRDSIARDVQEAWAQSDFAKLDSMAEGYVRTRARTLSGK